MSRKKTEVKEIEIEVSQVEETDIVEVESLVNNSFGPTRFERDEYGLLKSVQYIFNEDGSVNWRAMIKPEHLYVNKDRFPEGKAPESIEGLDDSKLLIKLSGIKELAKLRGFDSVHFNALKCRDNHAAFSCVINWIGNYETQNDPVTYMDVASATINNCDGFSAKFLESIAANRAFVRCVRNFLNIHIVGADEIDKSASRQEEDNSFAASPQDVLAKNARSHKIEDFEAFKDFLRKKWAEDVYRNEDAKNWNSFKDIPAKDVRILLAILNSES